MAANGTDFLHENAEKLEKYSSEMTKQGPPSDYPPPYAPSGSSVVVAQPQYTQQVVMIQREELPKNDSAICASVFVLCCCSLPLGIIALVFAGLQFGVLDPINRPDCFLVAGKRKKGSNMFLTALTG